jgi:hypothetical protein
MVRYCPACGEQLQFENAETCPKCGIRIVSPLNLKPKKSEGRSSSSLYLIIGIVFIFGIIIIATVYSYVILGDGFFSTHKTPNPTSSDSSSTRLSTQITHTPSEIIQGHLNAPEYTNFTTKLWDPQTSRYTIKLIGPETADFDLYVKKEGSSNNYDFTSKNPTSNEQIDIMNPKTGNYTITINSYHGSGDFVLYIDYEYKDND